MINYIEKGAGLHDKIRAAGLQLLRDGQSGALDTGGHDAEVQAIIDGYTLADCKAVQCRLCAGHAKRLRNKVIAPYSAGEMAAWPVKLAEAAAYADSNPRDASLAPMLAAEALVRGISLDAMMGKVSGNASTFGDMEVQIAGVDGRHRDAINAIQGADNDPAAYAAVLAYDFTTGWPEI